MRLTIERMRTLVLAAAVLLIAALAGFLAVARWKNHFNIREIPQRLGVNIQQEANGVTYTQAHGGHTLFKIHASKVVQLKEGGRALLHDVQIELYGPDGNRVDRIAGDEFEYDQKAGKATAAGPVEITLMRPGETAAPGPGAGSGNAAADKAMALANKASAASQGEIHVKTSGLTFDQNSGEATTAERVEFTMEQGNGSSMGARFDSQRGLLVLDRAVELNVKRGAERVLLHAQHAEFERENLLCRLQRASAEFRGGEAAAGDANILFRQDGTAVRVDATDGFSMTTATSAHVAAPQGWLEFDEHNQPKKGRLEGGATLESSRNGRQVHGSSPAADLVFAPEGLLEHAHLERGVTMHSEETTASPDAASEMEKVTREWRSPVADLDFRPQKGAAQGQAELSSVRGTGGVAITGASQRGNGPVVPSRMAADTVTASFAPGQVLTAALGVGHAVLDQVAASGTRNTTSGDRIEVKFAPSSAPRRSLGDLAGGSGSDRHAMDEDQSKKVLDAGNRAQAAARQQIESATVDGNVVLIQVPTPKADQQQAQVRATAGHAVYEGEAQLLHLTINPRIENGGLQLTAEKVDVSQGSGDAFAHGNVKATWAETPSAAAGAKEQKPGTGTDSRSVALGGQGPAHIVAAEAQLHQASGEATFRGQVRLWQQANSISAPVIVLDRTKQTLAARTSSAADPVRVVMVSGNGADIRKTAQPGAAALSANNAQKTGDGTDPTLAANDAARMGHPAIRSVNSAPSVIRVRGGDLKYSEAERKAVMRGGVAGSVVAETGTATSVSDELELLLLPPGNHAGKDGGAAKVDKMIATGNVRVSSEGRRGTGTRLVYSGETGDYVLTGTTAQPPQMTEARRGTVTGEVLIFNSRDDSVSIEGEGRKTATETTAPK